MQRTKQNPWPTCLTLCVIALFGVCCAFAHGQTPNLVVSAGSTGQAPSLTVSSDSQSPWKCFTVSGGSGTYNVVWAESNGTTGGIFFGTIATSTSGPGVPGPAPAPTPTDLPIAALTTAVSAAVAGVDQATAVKMGDTYEALAKGVDSGVIVSPLQLQLATGTQLLANFNATELISLSKLTAAVNGWVDVQQCSGKLTPDHMDKYSRSYHAVGKALGAKTAPAATKPSTSKPVAAAETATGMVDGRSPLPAQSPCADGKCKMPAERQPRWRWRQ